MSETAVKQQWICGSCGFIYDPDEGDPDGGIPPGTAFEDIPDDWFCPVCGARKKDFEPYEGSAACAIPGIPGAAAGRIAVAVVWTKRRRLTSEIASGGIRMTVSPSGRMIAPRVRASSVTR